MKYGVGENRVKWEEAKGGGKKWKYSYHALVFSHFADALLSI